MEMSFIAPLASKFATKTGICGIGPAAAAFGVTRLINECFTDIVVLTGIGGTYEPDTFKIGNAVFAKKEVFGDLGRCSQDGIEPIVIDGNEIKKDYDLLKTLPSFVKEAMQNTGQMCNMATVSCASSSMQRACLISRLYGSQIENMEGASAAMVCQHYGIPFVEIRGISNTVGDVDKKNWRIVDAMKNASNLTELFLMALLTNGGYFTSSVR